MRTILVIMFVSAVVIFGLTYIGETMTLGVMGDLTVMTPEAMLKPSWVALKKIYGLWYYVRLADALVGALAIWGFFRAGKTQGRTPGSPPSS